MSVMMGTQLGINELQLENNYMYFNIETLFNCTLSKLFKLNKSFNFSVSESFSCTLSKFKYDYCNEKLTFLLCGCYTKQ